MVLVGNKSDLLEQRIVTRKEIDNFLEDYPDLQYFPASAKDNTNISEAFLALGALAMEGLGSEINRSESFSLKPGTSQTKQSHAGCRC
jgi:GTPase SAR1 family protein